MKTICKRTFVLFLALLMAVTALPVASARETPDAAAEAETGFAGNNAFDLIANQLTGGGETDGYSISALEISGGKAYVEIGNVEVCTVVVAVYEEDSMRMVSSGTAEVPTEHLTVEVALDTESLPEYFVAKAFLLDANHFALCKEYTTLAYTSDYNIVEKYGESTLTVSENYFVVEEEATAVFYYYCKNLETDLFLYSDAKGKIDKMYDDGSHGDAAAGDHLYSLVCTVKGDASVKAVSYYAKTGTTTSNSVLLYFFAPLNDEQIKAEEKKVEQLKKDIESIANDLTSGDYMDSNQLSVFLEKAEERVRKAQADGTVLLYKVEEDSVYIKLTSGLSVIYTPNTEKRRDTDSIGSDVQMTIMTLQPCFTDMGGTSYSSPLVSLPDGVEYLLKTLDVAARNIDSNFDNYSFNENYDDGAVTIDRIKSLHSNQIVLLHTHGYYGSLVKSCLCLGEEFNWSKYYWNIPYFNDCVADRIINGWFQMFESEKVFISSKFVEHYCKDLDNSLVYLAACESGRTSELADAFLSNGATAVIANSQKIIRSYNVSVLYETMKKMTEIDPQTNNYYTLSDALTEAKGKYGQNDTRYGGEGAVPYILGGTDADQYRLAEYDDGHIQFGTYPQSRVTDEATIAQLDAAPKTWKSYGYYSGTGSWFDGKMTPSDYMQFADFFVGSSKYRAVTFSNYRPYNTGYAQIVSYSYQDVNGYSPNHIYYFLYEPISWRILDPAEGLILSEMILDSQAYQNTVYYANSCYWQNTTASVYASDYATSSIRDWLNYDFYETAFTDAQKNNIRSDVMLNNDSRYDSKYNSAATRDKIFLLSYDEARTGAYWVSSSPLIYGTRCAQGTDYAQCQGLGVNRSSSYAGNSSWWLRSPGEHSGDACKVDSNGNFNGHYVDGTYYGVRPACRLSDLKSDISQSGNLFSETSGGAKKAAPAMKKLSLSEPLTYTHTGCVEGEKYVLLAVKDAAAKDLLAAGNLLYIDQQTAESETVTFNYVPRETGDCTVLVFGPDQNSHTHSYTAAVTKEPTCGEQGERTYTCACGDTYTEPIPATGEHTWDAGKVTKEPTETAEGERAYTCSVCGAVRTEVIEKPVPAAKPGDVNGDGKVTAADARLALRRAVGLETYEPGSVKFLACDVDGNGKVTAADARRILRAAVGLETL